jgi:hypothetical protein
MNKESNTIFESYKHIVKEQTDMADPSKVMIRLDNLINRYSKELMLDGKEITKLKQFLFDANTLQSYENFVPQAMQMQSSPVDADADTVNLQPGAVSEPGSPSATGYSVGQ